ncbi:MAG: hypothetical protein ACOY3P_13080 [Planctomycetota bacterium]
MTRAALLAALLFVSLGAKHQSQNFIVETADPNLAVKIAEAAEKCRHDLAISWLGKPLPGWAQKCPMTVQVGPHLGAGGATSFIFDRGQVFGWRMSIQGSAERIFDSVLPHEITHMIFATHFRQPLPRWADEGAATSVECVSERYRHRKMLVQFLQTGRGIAFNQMFAMREYPRDVMPLYAQGYSLADYLIQIGGRRKYVDFVADGLSAGNWPASVRKYYGHQNLGTLQETWLAWVRQGCPHLQPAADGNLQLAASAASTPAPSVYSRGRQPAVTALPSQPAARADDSGRGLVPIDWPVTTRTTEPLAASVATTVPNRTSSSAVGGGRSSTVLPDTGWRAPGYVGNLAAAPASPPSVYAPPASQQARPAQWQTPGIGIPAFDR